MTIHRAKGLEFPIVCVADLGRSPRLPLGDPARLPATGWGCASPGPAAAGRESALDYGALGTESRQAEEREERRLFYVAMTRARERLVLSGAARFEVWQAGTGRTAGPIAWIAPAFVPDLPAVVQAARRRTSRPTARTSSCASSVPRTSRQSRRPSRGRRPRRRTGAQPPRPPGAPDARGLRHPRSAPPVATLSYSSLGEYARCGYRFYAERVLGLPPGREAARRARRVPAGACAAPPTAACCCTRCSSAWTSAGRSCPPADAIVSAAARAGLHRRQAPRSATS